MESFLDYMSESARKAIEMDSVEEGALTRQATRTFLLNVFYF